MLIVVGPTIYCYQLCVHLKKSTYAKLKDDKTEENTFEILQHSDRYINNS